MPLGALGTVRIANTRASSKLTSSSCCASPSEISGAYSGNTPHGSVITKAWKGRSAACSQNTDALARPSRPTCSMSA